MFNVRSVIVGSRLPARLALSLMLLTPGLTLAESPEAVIAARLQQARPDLMVKQVKPSVAAGLYEVQLSAGSILYATADGEFFVLGDLFSVGVNGIVNLAEQQRNLARKQLLAAVPDEKMIIFAARGETRARVTVFTDVDCFYCQKLHREVPVMNRAGIEVRYLAYPRAGVGSESYRKIASAWCADNPQQAITALKNRETIADNVCPGNPVADQFMLGREAGVRGTPALVLESGEMVPGYLSSDDLAVRLGIR